MAVFNLVVSCPCSFAKVDLLVRSFRIAFIFTSACDICAVLLLFISPALVSIFSTRAFFFRSLKAAIFSKNACFLAGSWVVTLSLIIAGEVA